MFKNGQTNLYNTLMGNPSLSNSTNNSVGRYAGNTGSSDNFFTKKAKSIENALGTTGATIIGAANEVITNNNRGNMIKDQKTRMNDIAKKYGFNTYQDVWNARDAAEASGDTETLNKIDNVINPELQAQANANAKEANKFASDYKDYVKNDYIGQKTNQDRGKFLGSAINTMSTATDVLGLTNGPITNAIQGGIEGVADELEQNGLQNFDWARAGQNALTGAASGAVTGALNKGISNSLAKKGGNLFKGNNMVTRGLNNLGSNTALGRIGSTIATGAGRGALSGAVGGATGAGISAALNNQDVLGSALQGAVQGAKSGATTGGIMAGANMAINNTPGVGTFLKKVNQAQEDWNAKKADGGSFGERLNETWDESPTKALGQRINAKLGERIGEDVNAVRQGFQNVGEGLGILAERAGIQNPIDSMKNVGMGIKDVSNADNIKNAQFEMLQETNPMRDSYHTGIRSPQEINRLGDLVNNFDENEMFAYPDFTLKDAQNAVNNGEITVYSSKPIETGTFVIPSKMMAQDYAGSTGEVYSKTIPIDDFAAISSGDEGNYLPVRNQNVASTTRNISQIDPWDKLAQENGYRSYDDVIQSYMEANPNARINPNGMAGAITTWMDQNPGDYNPNSPTTATGWLKKAGSRLLESAKNRGVGMSIQDVANEQDGYSDDIRNMKINDGNIFQETAVEEPPVVQQTTTNRRARTVQPEITPEDQMGLQESPETEVYRALTKAEAKQRIKDIKADAHQERAAKDLLNQVGTATAPAAKADNMVENVKRFMDDGLTKPEEWKLASDAITGANGVASRMYRNLIKEAGKVDTFSGLGGKYGTNLEDTIDYYIKNAGLTGSDAKGVKNEIVGVIESLPSRAEGSLDMADDAADVMTTIRMLEARKRNYQGQDSRNYKNPDPRSDAKAEAIGKVSSYLENKIYEKVPDAQRVVTGEAIDELKSYFPNNQKWAKSVDDTFSNVKTGKDLRAAQKRFVQTSDYLENINKNYGTYGQKVGDVYGNALSQGLKKVPLVGGILAQAADSPWMNRRYADINVAIANKLRGEAIDLPSIKTVKNAETPVDNTTTNTPTNTPTPAETPSTTTASSNSNPSMNIYNAIGRQEGLSQGDQARVADYLTQANQDNTTQTLGNTLGVDNGATTLYNTMNGGTMSIASANPTNNYQSITGEFNTLEEERANYFFPPTGDYWSDMLSRAMRRAKNAEDYTALGSLYEMYQEATTKKSSEKDNSNPVNWSSSDRSSLLKAQNGLDQIDQLEQAYTNAVGEGSNGIQGTLRQWANNLTFGNADPSAENYVKQANSIGAGIIKNLVNLGSTEYDAQRYIDYLPKLTDTKEQASQKLQALKNAYQSVINNLYNVYAV